MQNLISLLKERENKSRIGITLGEVVSFNAEDTTVKISLFNGSVIIDKFYTSILDFTVESVGRKVIVAASEDNQTFFVLGYAYQYERG